MHNRSLVFAFQANKTGATNRENDSFIHPFAKNTPSCFFSSSSFGLDNFYILGVWYLKLGSKLIAWSKPGLVIGASSSGLHFFCMDESIALTFFVIIESFAD